MTPCRRCSCVSHGPRWSGAPGGSARDHVVSTPPSKRDSRRTDCDKECVLVSTSQQAHAHPASISWHAAARHRPERASITHHGELNRPCCDTSSESRPAGWCVEVVTQIVGNHARILVGQHHGGGIVGRCGGSGDRARPATDRHRRVSGSSATGPPSRSHLTDTIQRIPDRRVSRSLHKCSRHAAELERTLSANLG